ncbi:hypothetical protein [Endozoicomonas atrinae]|uniref:hypothetical protein n=1 Tax=Endozoicomonas atrinae TaxID=1333660 RepID=UPI003B007089
MMTLNKDNVRVLDVTQCPEFQSLGLKEVDEWLYADLNEMDNARKTRVFAIDSDIYRVALMYLGSDLIRPLLKEDDPFKKLAGTGMIYFDTDTYYESVKGVVDCLFKGAMFSNGKRL